VAFTLQRRDILLAIGSKNATINATMVVTKDATIIVTMDATIIATMDATIIAMGCHDNCHDGCHDNCHDKGPLIVQYRLSTG
jgi:hypothetical protein